MSGHYAKTEILKSTLTVFDYIFY